MNFQSPVSRKICFVDSFISAVGIDDRWLYWLEVLVLQVVPVELALLFSGAMLAGREYIRGFWSLLGLWLSGVSFTFELLSERNSMLVLVVGWSGDSRGGVMAVDFAVMVNGWWMIVVSSGLVNFIWSFDFSASCSSMMVNFEILVFLVVRVRFYVLTLLHGAPNLLRRSKPLLEV